MEKVPLSSAFDIKRVVSIENRHTNTIEIISEEILGPFELLDSGKVSMILGISRRRVIREATKGKLKYSKFGRNYMFFAENVIKFVKHYYWRS